MTRADILMLAAISFAAPHMTPALAVAMSGVCFGFACWDHHIRNQKRGSA